MGTAEDKHDNYKQDNADTKQCPVADADYYKISDDYYKKIRKSDLPANETKNNKTVYFKRTPEYMRNEKINDNCYLRWVGVWGIIYYRVKYKSNMVNKDEKDENAYITTDFYTQKEAREFFKKAGYNVIFERKYFKQGLP